MSSKIPDPTKVIRDGKVAVVYSPGFGAGWSTWSDEWSEFVLFDASIVDLVERGASEADVEAHLASIHEETPYLGGWEQCRVEWLQQGTSFTIHDYDGSESIRTSADLDHTA